MKMWCSIKWHDFEISRGEIIIIKYGIFSLNEEIDELMKWWTNDNGEVDMHRIREFNFGIFENGWWIARRIPNIFENAAQHFLSFNLQFSWIQFWWNLWSQFNIETFDGNDAFFNVDENLYGLNGGTPSKCWHAFCTYFCLTFDIYMSRIFTI